MKPPPLIDAKKCSKNALAQSVKEEANEAYTEEVVDYVNRLDVDRDIAFLNTCGWEVPCEISVSYKIFTFFLKKTVQFNLTAAHMVVLVWNAHKSTTFNLLTC
ncbi:unnamed protein product [Eruca vesicaria subsp. sativa]|uniref:Uncharacterized protein n=1 Tax=Eruca vesicaria subsp. sativa TaxID=29727 RepID=A0ABC8KRS4_ERUVS|nr:unnamed protein product [Eruca vesicaria subsp. sativa]